MVADLLDPKALSDAFAGAEAVCHLAAIGDVYLAAERPALAAQVNATGTANVCDAALATGVRRVIVASTWEVYGRPRYQPMDEDHPFNNKNFYGATKIAGEAMARAFHHRYGLPVVGLRYMNVYGPRQDYQGAYIAVIMKMLDAIDGGQGPTIMGDGSEAFDFVAVEDCAAANLCAMRAEVVDRFYNVGTGKRTSLKALAEMIVGITGCEKEINYAPRSQATLVRNRIGDPARARKDIGFEAKVDLMEGLKRVIAWRRSHRDEVAARRRAAGLPVA